jgi:hypothetical protein
MTNAVEVIQQLAPKAFGGYNLSTAQIAAICAFAGAAVHIAHQAVAAYGRAGGWQGVVRFIRTGSTKAQ